MNDGRDRNSRAGLGLGARKETINFSREAKVHRLPVLDYPTDVERPKTRGDCVNGVRPCPWVSCRHHLYLDLKHRPAVEVGAPPNLVINFPDRELEALEHTCSLDVVDEVDGPSSAEDIARYTNITRARIGQIELQTFARIRGDLASSKLLPKETRAKFRAAAKVLDEFRDEKPIVAPRGAHPLHGTSRKELVKREQPAPDEPTRVDEDLEAVSFFADAEEAQSELYARFVLDDFVPVSKAERVVLSRVHRAYERKLIDRGLIAPRISKHEKEDIDMERMRQVVEVYKRLEGELGRPPTGPEVAKDCGCTNGAATGALWQARKRGMLPRATRGPKIAGMPSRKKATPSRAMVHVKQASFAGSFEEALRAELERLDRRRERLVELLEAS